MSKEKEKKPAEFWVIPLGTCVLTEILFPFGFRIVVEGMYFENGSPRAMRVDEEVYDVLMRQVNHSWAKASPAQIETSKR